MADELAKITDPDYFFYWGKNKLTEENRHDFSVGVLQPLRALFYDRSEGAGLQEYENRPISVAVGVGVRYNIVRYAGRRNAIVTSGDGTYPERRIVTSQNVINVRTTTGQVDVEIYYIELANYRKLNSATLPLGVK